MQLKGWRMQTAILNHFILLTLSWKNFEILNKIKEEPCNTQKNLKNESLDSK